MADVEKLQEIFEAIDTIAKSHIKDTDSTIKCKIVKADQAQYGQYVVDDGTRKFTVYSDNKTYEVDDEVFVFIPGSEEQQEYKYIIGKCVKSDSPYYTYKDPFETYVDMTGNLISVEDEQALTANGSEQSIRLGVIQCDFTGYDRLAIKADFMTWLEGFGYISGNYGIRLRVTDLQRPNVGSATEYYKLYTLDSKEMYADPYNYQTWYAQKELFDISNLTNIIRITVDFYQEGNFKNAEGAYPTLDIKDAANIFMKGLHISLGYNLDSFNGDRVLLTTPQSTTYVPYLTDEMKAKIADVSTGPISRSRSNVEATVDTYNAKNVLLRWVHKADDDTLISIKDDDEKMEHAHIHWYRYNLTPDLADPLAGVFWEEQMSQANKFELLNFIPDTTVAQDKLKAIVEVMPEDMDESRYQSIDIESAVEPDDIEFYEKYSASIERYYSDELVFTNEGYVPDYTTVDLINGLKIEADVGGYNGVYHLYNSDGHINSNSEANKRRILTATYSSLISGITELDTAEQITWIIPTVNTMITQPQEGIEFDSIKDKVQHFEDRVEITREGIVSSTVPGSEEADSAQQIFRIKSYYTQAATNNIIICRLTKNNRTYEAQINLAFGVHGTQGTDYTFTIEFANGENALEAKNGMKAIVRPVIYDADNNDITNGGLFKIDSWSWYSQGRGGIAYAPMSDGRCVLQAKTNDITSCHHYILQCTAIGVIPFAKADGSTTERTIKLFAYLPIPVKKADMKYVTMNGADTVRYNTSGTNPIFYNDLYSLFDYDTMTGQTKRLNATWDMAFGNDCAEAYGAGYKFYPQISSQGKLTVPSLYLQGTGKQIAVMGSVNGEIIWTQPLRVFIDAYGSPLLNSWDGNLTFDENNGTILSTMVGAGVKDTQNRFNGVLMGDVKTYAAFEGATVNAGYYTGIGLYGYHEGIQSFGLNISGKAFFGKAGRGQILIDGSTGTIQSAEYASSNNGMKIDLDEGILTSKRGNALIQIDPTHASGAYFKIRSDNNNTLMYVGDSNYYLQSDNYAENNTGMKINLANGTLETRQGNGMVRITGGDSAYFQIRSTDNNQLVYISNGSYYLQSNNFAENQGLRVDLGNGTFELRQARGKVLMTGNGSPYFQITDTSGKDLVYISDGSYYIQSSNYQSGIKSPTGVKIDLGQGIIYAERGNIGAWQLTSAHLMSYNGKIILDAETGLIHCKNSADDLLFEADSTKSTFRIGPWHIDKTAIWAGTNRTDAKTVLEPDGEMQLTGEKMILKFDSYGFSIKSKETPAYPSFTLSNSSLICSVDTNTKFYMFSNSITLKSGSLKISVSEGVDKDTPDGSYKEGAGIRLQYDASTYLSLDSENLYATFGKVSDSEYHGIGCSKSSSYLRCGAGYLRVQPDGIIQTNNGELATKEWCQANFDQVSQLILDLGSKIKTSDSGSATPGKS